MPSTDKRKHLDQSQLGLDDSIVYENDDDDASKGEEDTNIKQMISPSKSTATNVTTPTSPDGSFVHDWNVVETLIDDSSSEFSDAEYYQLDLVEEGAIPVDEEDMISKHINGIVSSICSIDSDDGSCSDFDENDELLEDNDLPSNLVAEDEFDSGELEVVGGNNNKEDKNTKGVEVSVVIENPPSVGDSSDFEEDEDESLGLDDGVIVAEDGIVVVVDDNDLATAYNTTNKVVGKDSTAYLVPPMRQIPRLNNLI